MDEPLVPDAPKGSMGACWQTKTEPLIAAPKPKPTIYRSLSITITEDSGALIEVSDDESSELFDVPIQTDINFRAHRDTESPAGHFQRQVSPA
jgi:hypothetical protein